MMKFQKILFLSLFLLVNGAQATVKLPAIFSDNMVLQRDFRVPLWGWAEVGEQVRLIFQNKTYQVSTPSDGKWVIRIDKFAAGGPYEMVIKGANNQIIIKNILVGDVWVASGQSNMERGMQTDVINGYKINPVDQQIRFFYVPMSKSLELKQEIQLPSATSLNGKWIVCSPRIMETEWAWHGFSAVGYYFATEIRRSANVPVGMIGTYKGGTPAQSWISMDGLEKDADFNKKYIALHQSLVKGFDSSTAPNGDGGFGAPSNLFNAMINPIIPYGIKGVIWYQGESNGDSLTDAVNYTRLFPQLIKNWREKWGQGDFPFLWVQLPNFRSEAKLPSEGNWAWVREAQTKALNLPNTGMAVTIDLGEAQEIHPKNKLDVGLRLAIVTKKLVYKENLEYSGPIYDKMEVKNGKIYLSFKHVSKGLMLFGKQAGLRAQVDTAKVLKGFGIAAADGKFVWAKAQIENNQVVVFSEGVSHPVAVRYNWADNPPGNLYNSEGLPAIPFRTDSWVPAK